MRQNRISILNAIGFLSIPLVLVALMQYDAYRMRNVEVQFRPFVRAFEASAKLNGRTILISDKSVMVLDGNADDAAYFAKLPHVVAFCDRHADGSKYIVVKREYWSRITDLQKRLVLFHEFGHCYLDLDHVNEIGAETETDRHIMDGLLMDETTYQAKQSQYETDLFKPVRKASAK